MGEHRLGGESGPFVRAFGSPDAMIAARTAAGRKKLEGFAWRGEISCSTVIVLSPTIFSIPHTQHADPPHSTRPTNPFLPVPPRSSYTLPDSQTPSHPIHRPRPQPRPVRSPFLQTVSELRTRYRQPTSPPPLETAVQLPAGRVGIGREEKKKKKWE